MRPLRRSRVTTRILALVVVALASTACDHYTATGQERAGAVTPALTPAPPDTAEMVPPSGCAAPTIDLAAVSVETLHRIDRSCVEPSDAMIVRCDPALEPVAILGTGRDDERAFLGGSFAVPVDEIPQTAAAIGFGPTGRIYVSPSDERLLYVQSGGRAERWLALPRPRDVAEPPTALMVGDSILEGSADPLVEALPGWSLSIDAEIGRSSVGGVAVVEAAATVPDVAVIELGTNDPDAAAFRVHADRILAAPAVRDADLIVWLTARNPEPVTPAVNREIVTAVGGVPSATVADWDRFVPPEALNGDGVHLALGSEGVFADFVASVLETWRAAVHHRGSVGCRAALLEALG